MTEFKPITCPECGHEVRLARGVGRTREYRRGVPPMPIPDDFDVPTCSNCGETFMLAETLPALEESQHQAYLSWQSSHLEEIVRVLSERHGASKRQIAGICGVTPSHLSHLLAGTDAASVTLLRLMESLLVCRSEFERHIEGSPLPVASAFPYGVHSIVHGQYGSMSGASPRWAQREDRESANDNAAGALERMA